MVSIVRHHLFLKICVSQLVLRMDWSIHTRNGRLHSARKTSFQLDPLRRKNLILIFAKYNFKMRKKGVLRSAFQIQISRDI